MTQANKNTTIKADKKSLPMVSVVMPAYNAEAYIRQAIESVQNQTYKNWELVVINDCSKDGTSEIVKELQENDERIRMLCNEKNLGVSKTRNKGFTVCQGKYIALLDSDDVWHSEKLEKQMQILEETDADISYSSYAIISEDGATCCEDFLVPETTNYKRMLRKSEIGCSTAIFRSELVQKYHFIEGYHHEDYVLWLTMLRDGLTARGTSEVLVDYRQVENSRAANKVLCAASRWRIYRDYLKLPLLKSIGYFMQYSLSGMKKYQKI